MSINNSSSWWEIYREAVNVTKHYNQLTTLVNDRRDIAQQMVDLEKRKYPGKTESWYLMKIIKELQQENLMKIVS